jgi:hypothetical protein
MSARRASPVGCPPCGKPGTLHGPAVALKFTPKRPTPLNTGVALNETAWKNDKGEEVECTICADPMSADSGSNPWTGPGLFLTQACVNGHVYHKGCLLTHMSRSNNINSATCPECRNPILSEVAASLRRNGAPAPVPPPLNSGGGGLFGGGGGGLFRGDNAPAPAPAPAPGGRSRAGDRPGLNNDDAAALWERIHGGGGGGGGGGGLFADLQPSPNPFDNRDYMLASHAADDARRAAERRRLENEERRAAQLPYQSLEPLPPMTGINGHFFLVGGLDANPTPAELVQAMRDGPYGVNVPQGQVYADKLHVKMSEQNLNPFHGGSESGGMRVTLVRYEFNGLTNEEGDNFLGVYQATLGETENFYQRFFDLTTTPMVGANGAPKWGEDPSGMPPALSITPDDYDEWAREAREERERMLRQWEEHVAETDELRAERTPSPAGPRTRARAAAEAEAAREERERLDDF